MYVPRYTVVQLKKMCKDKGIKGYSKLKKAELMKHCLKPESLQQKSPKKSIPSSTIKCNCKKTKRTKYGLYKITYWNDKVPLKEPYIHLFGGGFGDDRIGLAKFLLERNRQRYYAIGKLMEECVCSKKVNELFVIKPIDSQKYATLCNKCAKTIRKNPNFVVVVEFIKKL